MNSLQLAIAMLVDPRAAFKILGEKPRFLLPLLLLTLGTGVVVALYFLMVDISWFHELIVASDPRIDKAKAERLPITSRNVMLATSLAAVMVGIPAARLLESAYYFLAGKVVNISPSFRHWMSLACWSSLPLLIPALVMVIVLFLHPNGQVSQEQLNLLSVNEVFGGLPRANRWHTLATTLTVLHPWAWGLAALGVKVWTGRSWLFCAAFALIPPLIFYGGWALVTAL
jgi:Yip1 domain